MRNFAPATLAWLLVACGDTSAPGPSTGPGITTLALSTSTTGDASSTSSSGSAPDSTSSSGSGSGSASLDMGTPPDFGEVQPSGCKGKIDFLFIIQRSGSMKVEQAQLVASIPGFIATIQQAFADFDVHVLVANTTGGWGGWSCETQELCGTLGHCGPHAEDYVCGVKSWDQLTECDEVLGAGLLFNAGPWATNHACELYEGRRYIQIPGEPDPAAAFDCIARVGTYGGVPQQKLASATLAALSDDLNEQGSCNEGFLRDDALLVITLITDKDDGLSYAGPTYWYEQIVLAKGGDPDSIVMLAILAQPWEGEGEPTCAYDVGGTRIGEFVEKFPRRGIGDICAPTFVPFFEEASVLVDEACSSFIPQ